MPTTDIIGYLWTQRQALGLYSLADVLQMVLDLSVAGLDCIRVDDIEVFGAPTGEARVEYVRLTSDDWAERVSRFISAAAVEQMTEDRDLL